MQLQEEYIWERLMMQRPHKNTDVAYENHLLMPVQILRESDSLHKTLNNRLGKGK